MTSGRVIPVAFAAIASKDPEPTYLSIMNFYTCGPTWAAADIAGINMLWWIPSSNPDSSGYTQLWENVQHYSKPFIFTKFSSVLPVDASTGKCPCQNRTFKQVHEMYTAGSHSLSGGLAFEYSDELELSPDPLDISTNKGIVKLQGSTVEPKGEFAALQAAFAIAYPPRLNMSEYNPSDSPIECPSNSPWNEVGPLPPAPFDASSSTAMASTGSGPGGKKGLSTGEIVGISLGCGAVGVCILAAVAYQCIKKRRQSDYQPFDD